MAMIDTNELKAVFNDKLAKTNSMDEAFTKAVWVAVKVGIKMAQNNDIDIILIGEEYENNQRQ